MSSIPPLPPALPAEGRELDGPAGRIHYYVAAPARAAEPRAVPLLLVHSINAAG